MKDNNVVDLSTKAPHTHQPPVTDFWFAQVEVRLGRIERIIKRLEWQIWMLVCGAGALLFLELIQRLAPQS